MRIESEQFNLLWKKIEERFANDNEQGFSLIGLREHASSLGVNITSDELKSIENKFYNFYKEGKEVNGVNLTPNLYTKLFKYVGINGFHDLIEDLSAEEIAKRVEEKSVPVVPEAEEPPIIEFIGRQKELEILEEFLVNSQKRVFGLYGVPMIGKSWLIERFLKNNPLLEAYQILVVKFNPAPEDPQQKIKDTLFKHGEMNDFSVFSGPTLIVIQNFEMVLNWRGEEDSLLDIDNLYKDLKILIQKIAASDFVKIIIESRFQINDSFITQREVVQTLPGNQLKGVDKKEFWPYYQAQKMDQDHFEKMCANFSNHTGLLALAYNRKTWLYDDDLNQAVYQPRNVTIKLWRFVEQIIISQLEQQEIWILCALTYLQAPTPQDELIKILRSIDDFKDSDNLEDYFFSLKKKLLTQNQQGMYELNPYLREVCYTFLKDRRRTEMDKLAEIPMIKEQGAPPLYDEAFQLAERCDYGPFFKKIDDYRKKGLHDQVLNILFYTYKYNEFFTKKITLLNEIGITYRKQKKHKEAIEILNKATIQEPQNIRILNELGINLREVGKLEESVSVLQKACDLGNIPSFNEIATTLKKMKKPEEAKQALRKGIIKDRNNFVLLEHLYILLKEEKRYQEALEVLEEGARHNPRDLAIRSLIIDISTFINRKKIFISYVQADLNIKRRLDAHLFSLKDSSKISTWDDEKVRPGQELNQVIDQKIKDADIILFLISADFLASKYIWKNQVEQAIERHHKKEATVIPIYCKPCDITDTPFEKIKGLPENKQPISSQSDQDASMTEIAMSLRKLIEQPQ